MDCVLVYLDSTLLAVGVGDGVLAAPTRLLGVLGEGESDSFWLLGDEDSLLPCEEEDLLSSEALLPDDALLLSTRALGGDLVQVLVDFNSSSDEKRSVDSESLE